MGKLKLIMGFLLIGSLALIFSCKKKSESSGDNPSNGYRIIQERDYANNVLQNSDDFSYSGSQLMEILAYMRGTKATADGKITIEYNGGNISKVSVFMNNNGTWLINEDAVVNSYTGSMPSERIIKNYDSAGMTTYQVRYTDTYLNGQVSEEKSYSMQNGLWELYSRAAYTYNPQGQLQKIVMYSGTGSLQTTTSYTWQNNLIVSEMRFALDSLDRHKTTYDYSGTSLIKASRSFYTNSTWYPTGTSDYAYNANGNLISQTDKSVPASVEYRLEFDYAAARGNFRQLFIVMGVAELWNGAPDPMPAKSSVLPSSLLKSLLGRNASR
ncbi:MAG: hypothetical protein WCK92_12555 [Bacteroidota bacterium]